jgi:cytochrome c oxidase assembly protein subunit 15
VRGLARAGLVAVFLLMIVGNVVSATGSGLACPDWPLCHGRLIPPLRGDVLIEYGHRLTAAVTSILVLATIVAAIRNRTSAGVRRAGLALLVLLVAQIALGGITVLLRLPDLISTAHLVTALLILAGLVVLAVGGQAVALGATAPRIRRLTQAGLVVLLLQLALGGYVRHSGAGLACPDFPLCSGDWLPAHWLATVHWTHRWLGVILLGFFVHLAIVARRTPLAGAAALAAALALAQVSLGIAAVLLRLDPPVRAAHAAVGYSLWATLVWISVRAGTVAIPLRARELGALHAS